MHTESESHVEAALFIVPQLGITQLTVFFIMISFKCVHYLPFHSKMEAKDGMNTV